MSNSGDARYSHTQMRLFLEEATAGPVSMTAERYRRLSACLNAIADRLQTCDALEAKLEKLLESRGSIANPDAEGRG